MSKFGLLLLLKFVKDMNLVLMLLNILFGIFVKCFELLFMKSLVIGILLFNLVINKFWLLLLFKFVEVVFCIL